MTGDEDRWGELGPPAAGAAAGLGMRPVSSRLGWFDSGRTQGVRTDPPIAVPVPRSLKPSEFTLFLSDFVIRCCCRSAAESGRLGAESGAAVDSPL